MKQFKKFVSIVLSTMMVLSLVACGTSKTDETSGNVTTKENTTEEAVTTEEATKEEATVEEATTEEAAKTEETATTAEGYTIGWSVYNSAYEYFQLMEDGVVDKCKELGITVINHDEKEDEAEMITGCSNLIAQGIDALVISPCKPEAMNTIVELAKEKDIPVIIVDIGDGGSDKDAIIISNVFGGGQMGADYALELIKKYAIASKNAAIIKCEESAVYAIRRGEGFKENITAAGYTIVSEITANSAQDQGYEAMQDILASYKDDLAVVFCENDNMALGAAQAIDEAGKTGEILVIGFNGDAAAVEAIKDGSIQGTVAQDPYGMGALGVELAVTAIEGGTITYDDETTKEVYADVSMIGEDGEAIK